MMRPRVQTLSWPWRWAAAFALLALANARAAEAPGWADSLASTFANVDVPGLDSTTLSDRLSPAIVLSAAKCLTGRLPDPTSAVPVTGAMIAFGDDTACDRPTPVALMEFGIEGRDTAPVARIRAVLAERLGKPCFNGMLPNDPRRRAPARSEIAWKTTGHVITLVQESGSPAAASLAAFATALQPGPGVAAGYATLRSQYLANLPAPCR